MGLFSKASGNPAIDLMAEHHQHEKEKQAKEQADKDAVKKQEQHEEDKKQGMI